MKEVIRVVDAQLARQGDRRCVDVAVGVLVAFDGQFLMTSRPPGKVYAGYWEFPGGKLEAGEGVAQALARELHEEIGIDLGEVLPWRQELVDYPHALVRLHFCLAYDWRGEMVMREHQQAQWCRLDALPDPVLPGSIPVLEWLQDEPGVLRRPS